MSRTLVTLALLAALLSPALAAPGEARGRIVILDRGRGAKDDASRLSEVALRIAGDDAASTLILYGTRAGGRPRFAVVRGDRAAALREADTKEGWDFTGPTDVRQGVLLALERRTFDTPVDLALVGPFSGTEDLPAGQDDAALETWRNRAPEGSRIWPLALGTAARRAVGALPGVVGSGWVLLDVGPPAVEVDPHSPIAPDEPYRARVRARVDAAVVGVQPDVMPLLVSTDGADDVKTRLEGAELVASVARPTAAVAKAQVEISVADDVPVLVAAALPEPARVVWDQLRPDARLVKEDVAPVEALDLEADRPLVVERTIERVVVGAPARWTARGRDAALPEEVEVAFGETRPARHDVERTPVTIRMHAVPGHPIERSGTIVLDSGTPGVAIELSYHVVVLPGHGHARLDAPGGEVALPAGEDDDALDIDVERDDANAPPEVALRLDVDPAPPAGLSFEVTLSDGRVLRFAPGREIVVPLPGRHRVVPRLAKGTRPFAATVTLAAGATPGVVLETKGRATLRPRRPRLRLEGGGGFRLEGDRVVPVEPLRLRLDSDGGDETWRLALLEHPPALRVGPSAPVRLVLVPDAPGLWRIEAAGPWRGERGAIFSGRAETVPIEIAWSEGGTPRSVEVRVDVPARWGRLGLVLIGLAGIALLVGAIAASHLRAAPLEGTLLYAVEGKAGAVGRVDLAPAGRRARTLVSDPAGRLALGGDGEAVARVRPSRVGGFLDVPGPNGVERHLLVDGLVVTSGRHRVRYISGQVQPPPGGTLDPVPDLLGPEFELETGRVEKAIRSARPDRAQETGDPESGAG